MVDKPAGRRRAPGARARDRARSPRRSSRGARPAGRTRRARASCTGSTATRRACWSSPATRPCTPRCRRRCASARITREYLALVEGRPPARSGTIDAPLGRDRRVRTRMSTDTDDAARGGHPLRDRARARGLHAAAGAARDRPHAPDPRAPDRRSAIPVAGDPEYGHAGALGLAAPVPARRRGSRSTIPSPGETVDVGSPLPEDLATALRQASGESGRSTRMYGDSGGAEASPSAGSKRGGSARTFVN